MDRYDIHNHKKSLETRRRKLKQDDRISPRNKELILEFEKELILKGLSTARKIKYLVMLGMISRRLKKDFDKVTKKDLQDFVLYHIEEGCCELPIKKNKPYTEWTKQSYKVFLKRFYQWLKNCPEGEYPPIVSWIKTTANKKKIRHIQASELITEEDVKDLIKASENRRDKAIVSMLAETGMRISELGGLRIKDIYFDDIGATLNVVGKMGPRIVRTISSVPYLKAWLHIHKFKEDKESYLWLKLQGRNVPRGGGNYMLTTEERQLSLMNEALPMTYGAFTSLLRRLFQKAGIKGKRINPHSFRHARASKLAEHLTEHQMDTYFGWVVGSRMASSYVHMTGKSLDPKLCKLNGIELEEDSQVTKLKPQICSRCKLKNSFEDEFCSNCGSPLDLAKLINYEEQLKEAKKRADENKKLVDAMLEIPLIREEMKKKLGLS